MAEFPSKDVSATSAGGEEDAILSMANGQPSPKAGGNLVFVDMMDTTTTATIPNSGSSSSSSNLFNNYDNNNNKLKKSQQQKGDGSSTGRDGGGGSMIAPSSSTSNDIAAQVEGSLSTVVGGKIETSAAALSTTTAAGFGTGASKMLQRTGYGWLLELEDDGANGEEPLKPLAEELDIDLKDILRKVRAVALPLKGLDKERTAVRASPDFWGPLFVAVLYAVVCVYGQFTAVSWILTSESVHGFLRPLFVDMILFLFFISERNATATAASSTYMCVCVSVSVSVIVSVSVSVSVSMSVCNHSC